MSKIAGKLKIPVDLIKKYTGNTIEFYQKQAAKIDSKLHIDNLKKMHDISLSLSPEYKTYFTSQESKLADFSYRIFGDFQTINSYVHLVELFFYVQIKNTNGTEDEKRKASLIHGAKVTKQIGDKFRSYKRNPLNLWSDIFYYTFDEGNKYIDETGTVEYAGTIKELAEQKKEFKDLKDKLNDLRLFDIALDEINLFTLDAGIKGTINQYNNLYNERLKPAFITLNKIYKEQQAAIVELEKRAIEQAEKQQRIDILTANPDTLNDKEKVIQSNQFLRQLESAIPGVSERFKFKTIDIGDL